MIRLGHIEYSNCFPVHALLVDRQPPPGIELVPGIPSFLNAELSAGRVHVAPSSSIEYARHGERYRLMPDLVIGSDGPVGSILLERTRPLQELDGLEVAIPTASATSVVLLRALLELRDGQRPRYRWFDQSRAEDPIAAGAAAVLWIGDVALRRPVRDGREFTDLGAEWRSWTGLPFAFALWQVSAGPERDEELLELHGLLRESIVYYRAHVEELADRHAQRYQLESGRLARYWRSLTYTLDDRMQGGLLRFYEAAVELGEAPTVPALRWIGSPGG